MHKALALSFEPLDPRTQLRVLRVMPLGLDLSATLLGSGDAICLVSGRHTCGEHFDEDYRQA
ncbi:MAG: hypothetical protein WAN81_19230 [Candidatus Binataceae bacterium]